MYLCIYTYTWMHVYTYIYVYTYTYAYIHTRIYTWLQIYMYMCTHIYIYAVTHVYTYIPIHTYIRAYIFIYIHCGAIVEKVPHRHQRSKNRHQWNQRLRLDGATTFQRQVPRLLLLTDSSTEYTKTCIMQCIAVYRVCIGPPREPLDLYKLIRLMFSELWWWGELLGTY